MVACYCKCLHCVFKWFSSDFEDVLFAKFAHCGICGFLINCGCCEIIMLEEMVDVVAAFCIVSIMTFSWSYLLVILLLLGFKIYSLSGFVLRFVRSLSSKDATFVIHTSWKAMAWHLVIKLCPRKLFFAKRVIG